jgi:SMC interacting uncharacterized protein involved in chromosome segregation
MSNERDSYTGKTIAQATRRVEEIEHDLALLEARKRRFYADAEKFKLSYMQLDMDSLDEWNDELKRLHEELSHLEMFLAERGE